MRYHHTPMAAALAAAFAAAGAFAADAPADQVSMAEIVITGARSAVPANLLSTTESVTAQKIDETINAVTAAAALNYLPSMHVRERYIGDRNGILVMRVNSSVASAQTAVYADHLLLSNFLNNSFSTPPRWGMVAPSEIERIDVVYGPFSALYPGNSAGGVVLMSTRMPDKFEAQAAFDLMGQRFKLYGTDGSYNGSHFSAALGNKAGAWSFRISVDHLDNKGQPQTFGTAARAGVGGTPAFTRVVGGYRDTDTAGNPRIVVSAVGADSTLQDNGKLKLAYAFSPSLRATYTLGAWKNAARSEVGSYLRDADGNAVYNTTAAGAGKYVRFDGDANYYTLAGTSPTRSDSEHLMHGLALKGRAGGWDWEAGASAYRYVKDRARSAANRGSLHDSGTGAMRPGGTLTAADGTGWATFDLRGEWRPGGAHQVATGYHADRYQLASVTSAIGGDWLGDSASAVEGSNSHGKTQTQALYLQDAWQVAPAWKLVAGARAEHWRAFDGSNFNSANVAQYRQLDYAARSSTDVSPKLALSFTASQDWALRAAVGKAVRYPTVAEIFQVINLPNDVRQNDPNLKPERVVSGELVAERGFASALLRTSLFWENKRDALIAQSDTTVIPNTSSIQNVDQVRTVGLETAFDATGVLARGLDINGSATYTHSTIRANRRNPGLAGSDQPRIPDWRATVVATYRADDRLSYSLSYRFSGRQHNALLNSATGQYNDVNPDVYGAVSRYSVFDAKVLYRLTRQWSAAVGMNNIGSDKYYVNPNPYPQRTVFASARFNY